MGCEERVRLHRFTCCIEIQTAGNEFATAFQAQEGCMPFIKVPGGGRDTQGAQRAHTTDTQHNLLRNAYLAVATIETGGEFAVVGRIGSDIGIHQVERDAADHQLPDFGKNAATREVNANYHLIAVWSYRGNSRCLREVQLFIDGLLHAIAGDTLGEVALRVEEAYAYEGQA